MDILKTISTWYLHSEFDIHWFWWISTCGKIHAINHPTKQYHNVASNHLKYLMICHLTYNRFYIIELNVDSYPKSVLYLDSISIIWHFLFCWPPSMFAFYYLILIALIHVVFIWYKRRKCYLRRHCISTDKAWDHIRWSSAPNNTTKLI